TTVAPAGGSRILVRSGGGPVAWHTLRGSWLGLVSPDPADQHTWVLSSGDELLLASDGLFDQIGYPCGTSGPLPRVFADGKGSATLFDAVHQVLQEALQKHPQEDDITMITVRKVDTMASEAVST